MLVTLPSGAVAPLEVPGLLPLLAGGGTTVAIARATLTHGEVDAGSLTSEDAFAVALWGVQEFCEDEEALALAAVSHEYGMAPAQRLGVEDAALAWALDSGCLAALRRREQERSRSDKEAGNEAAVRFSLPDTPEGQ